MNLVQKDPLLLVVDMQNVYDNGQPWECPNFRQAAANIKKLASSGITESVMGTRFIASADPSGVWKDYNRKYALINSDKAANALCTDLEEILNGFPVYDKSTYSSLKCTAVKEAASAAPYVILTGVTAGCCVLSTLMDLIDAGIYTVVVKDACAGTSISCEEAVWKTLEGLSPLHLLMTDTDGYLSLVSELTVK